MIPNLLLCQYISWSSYLAPWSFKRGRLWISFSIFLENSRKGSKWQLTFLYSSQTIKAWGGIQAARSHTLSKGTLKSSATFPGRQCRQASDVFMKLHYKVASKICTTVIRYDTCALLCISDFSLSWLKKTIKRGIWILLRLILLIP